MKKEHIYFVKGMHCPSCEILIEKKLLETMGIKAVEASNGTNKVLIEYEDRRPTIEELNNIFQKDGYTFFDQPLKTQSSNLNNILKIISVALLVVVGFIFLNKSISSGHLIVNSKSSLPAFFLFGLLAGVSSCAALVGGLVLSMSKQWSELYKEESSFRKKIEPHFLFNLGRLISYGLLGAVLGLIGSKLQFSLGFSSLLVIAVSIIMIFLGLQMLGLKAFSSFQLTLPRFITRYIADENNFKGKYMPFLLGALTFFLPCGFTITAQGLALLSGSALQGSLIMTSFVLGTLPPLLLISFSSVKFLKKPHLSTSFLKVAGVLVLFFALFNINSQLNVLGAPSLNNFKFNFSSGGNNIQGLPPIINGKQVITMNASSTGYSPNYFKVRVGVPVRWEVTDKGTSGCTNAIISRGLFDKQINLTPGETSVREFTPQKPGIYKFSCWMGMISGTIEVVDENTSSKNSSVSLGSNLIVPSGAKGCDSGGGGNTCDIIE